MERRIFWPGLLALVGTASPIAYLVNFVVTLDTCAAGAEKVGGGAFCLFILPFIMLTVGAYVASSIIFFFRRGLVWAVTVSITSGLLFFSFAPNQYHRLASACCPATSTSDWILFVIEAIPPAIGVAGGIWGFFSKDSLSSHSTQFRWFVPRLVMASVPLGLIGVFSAFNGQLSSGFPTSLISIAGPVLVFVCAVLLQKGLWKVRPLGSLVVLGSILPLLISSVIATNGVDWYYPPYAPGMISVMAWSLTIVVGIRMMIGKPIIRPVIKAS